MDPVRPAAFPPTLRPAPTPTPDVAPAVGRWPDGPNVEAPTSDVSTRPISEIPVTPSAFPSPVPAPTPAVMLDGFGGEACLSSEELGRAREYATLSHASYDPSANEAGWTRIEQSDLRSPLLDDSSGFKAAVFRRGDQTVVAFAGTEGLFNRDMATDLRQGVQLGLTAIAAALGFDPMPQQYKQADALLKEVRDKYGDNVSATGHSLGGGLATYAGLLNNVTANVFNSAGMGPITRWMLDRGGYLNRADELVTNINVRNEALSSKPLIPVPGISPQQVGRQFEISPVREVSIFDTRSPGLWFLPGLAIGMNFLDRQRQRVANHTMDQVEAALDLEIELR